MTTPPRSDHESPQEPEYNELVNIFVDELPTTALRILLRDHMLWLFVGAGIASVGFVMPTGGILTFVRMLVIAAGLLFGGIRLMQANGIIQELRRRGRGDEPPVRRDESRGSESPADPGGA